MITNKFVYSPAIIWIIISTVLLTIPGSSIPKEDWLDKLWIDKWVHIGMFAIMVFLWCRAFSKKYIESGKLKTIFYGFATLCFAYGVGMEFVQKYFIPNRSFDLGDIAADALGCVVGLIYSMSRYKKN
ncbi:MAG: VanZ family protein [Bacteroidota bacterium]